MLIKYDIAKYFWRKFIKCNGGSYNGLTEKDLEEKTLDEGCEMLSLKMGYKFDWDLSASDKPKINLCYQAKPDTPTIIMYDYFMEQYLKDKEESEAFYAHFCNTVRCITGLKAYAKDFAGLSYMSACRKLEDLSEEAGENDRFGFAEYKDKAEFYRIDVWNNASVVFTASKGVL